MIMDCSKTVYENLFVPKENPDVLNNIWNQSTNIDYDVITGDEHILNAPIDIRYPRCDTTH